MLRRAAAERDGWLQSTSPALSDVPLVHGLLEHTDEPTPSLALSHSARARPLSSRQQLAHLPDCPPRLESGAGQPKHHRRMRSLFHLLCTLFLGSFISLCAGRTSTFDASDARLAYSPSGAWSPSLNGSSTIQSTTAAGASLAFSFAGACGFAGRGEGERGAQGS